MSTELEPVEQVVVEREYDSKGRLVKETRTILHPKSTTPAPTTNRWQQSLPSLRDLDAWYAPDTGKRMFPSYDPA